MLLIVVMSFAIGGFSRVDLSRLAVLTIQLQVSNYGQLSDDTVKFNSAEQLVKNKAANAQITL